MGFVDMDMLAEPDGTRSTPTPVVLVDGLPIGVLIVGEGIVLDIVSRVEQFVPPSAGLAVGLHLCPHVVVVLEEGHSFYQHRIVPFQGVFRNPCLDRGTTPAVDDDALCYLVLLKHPFAEEIADGREKPGVLFIDGLPVDGGRTDVVLHTVGRCLILNPEHPDLRILVGVDFVDILGVNALYCHVDVRLS